MKNIWTPNMFYEEHYQATSIEQFLLHFCLGVADMEGKKKKL